ncbi:Bsp1p KNAG_0F03820 [Huiozyma naganishii CBS 8797]|uniref:Uncharacterized protein n=1 Tax=Huiozyma naganishii (strain ATCC MYA-139 / BCRC 22969 / CBS 8797 / KCTC 17520 / NBRC 10181 / NCYC 3082 / Yp74L-3) TaxID=1071383 RepID=J7S8R2_HUIN7|nr:hypothetical protein KNAG_0F03820 [Kazachstania naganishii CBS 8797]CCK71046.1 hypothetical protein KNAG_0F03820 [Kazachstania naganishii CBS 8797]
MQSPDLAYRSAYNYERTFSPRGSPRSPTRTSPGRTYVVSEEDYLLLMEVKRERGLVRDEPATDVYAERLERLQRRVLSGLDQVVLPELPPRSVDDHSERPSVPSRDSKPVLLEQQRAIQKPAPPIVPRKPVAVVEKLAEAIESPLETGSKGSTPPKLPPKRQTYLGDLKGSKTLPSGRTFAASPPNKVPLEADSATPSDKGRPETSSKSVTPPQVPPKKAALKRVVTEDLIDLGQDSMVTPKSALTPPAHDSPPASFLDSMAKNKLTSNKHHVHSRQSIPALSPTGKIVDDKAVPVNYLDSIQLKPTVRQPEGTTQRRTSLRAPQRESFIQSALQKDSFTAKPPSPPKKPVSLRTSTVTQSSPELVHITKGRPRGPKRKLPTSLV